MSGQQTYSPEEHAAAYYAQQGYDPSQVAVMSAGYSGSDAGASAGAGAYGAYPSAASAVASSSMTPIDGDVAQQSSIYNPGAAEELVKTGKVKPQGKRATVIRQGNGKTWEDPTLLDWDPKWFRLFVGDVSNDVNERTLDEAFRKYPSYCKCKVVRDRLSLKAKYGFIAFKDPEDFLKAWKEMDGKYVGNRPIRLTKVRDDKYGSIGTVQVGARKAKELDKLRRNHGKPLNGRPVPY
ncbi:hypothetical protein Q5752_004657 [Cryptotrichosporon argae]